MATANTLAAKYRSLPLLQMAFLQGGLWLWTFPCAQLKHSLGKKATMLYKLVSMLSP